MSLTRSHMLLAATGKTDSWNRGSKFQNTTNMVRISTLSRKDPTWAVSLLHQPIRWRHLCPKILKRRLRILMWPRSRSNPTLIDGPFKRLKKEHFKTLFVLNAKSYSFTLEFQKSQTSGGLLKFFLRLESNSSQIYCKYGPERDKNGRLSLNWHLRWYPILGNWCCRRGASSRIVLMLRKGNSAGPWSRWLQWPILSLMQGNPRIGN